MKKAFSIKIKPLLTSQVSSSNNTTCDEVPIDYEQPADIERSEKLAVTETYICSYIFKV